MVTEDIYTQDVERKCCLDWIKDLYVIMLFSVKYSLLTLACVCVCVCVCVSSHRHLRLLIVLTT